MEAGRRIAWLRLVVEAGPVAGPVAWLRLVVGRPEAGLVGGLSMIGPLGAVGLPEAGLVRLPEAFLVRWPVVGALGAPLLQLLLVLVHLSEERARSPALAHSAAITMCDAALTTITTTAITVVRTTC